MKAGVIILMVSMLCSGFTIGASLVSLRSGSSSEAYVCGFADGANYALKRLSLEPMEVKEKCSQYRDPLQ